MKIYCVWHRHLMKGGEFDDKIIGYYTSYERACLARTCQRFSRGFCDAPDDFHITIIEADPGPELYILYYNDLDIPYEEVQVILGYYGTLEEANRCRDRYRERRPFCDHVDGLICDDILLDRDMWSEGFTTEWA